ncbi:hypothetical protein WDJ51_08255 [Rathayibacter sp. YIM 133350]|uniref:hypothetical protein n=1 Tax=Rathayibacter sp. YIM 133350 TaxID=3131992 RepID=UPI00307D9516
MSDEAGAPVPSEPEPKEDGLGSEGTIPNEPGGIGVGATGASHFEPEEDPEAAGEPDASNESADGA